MAKSQKLNVLGSIVAIFIVGIFFLYTIKSLYENTESFPSTEENVVSDINTADWLIYENREYGYRFKYPRNTEVVDGKDPRFSFYNIPKSTFIILPEKYPNIKAPNYKDPETFLNYQISIEWMGELKQFGETTEEVIKYLDNLTRQSGRVINRNGIVTVIYDDGRSYSILQNNIYTISLDGSNPKDKDIQGWLKEINNKQLTKWVNSYPDYLRVLQGVYVTFELI